MRNSYHKNKTYLQDEHKMDWKFVLVNNNVQSHSQFRDLAFPLDSILIISQMHPNNLHYYWSKKKIIIISQENKIKSQENKIK